MTPLLQESWLSQDWDALVLQHAMTNLVPRHLEEVSAERLERIAKAEREIKARMQREINHWSRRYEELKLQEQAGKQVRLPAKVAKDRAEVLTSRLEKRLAQLQAEAQITAKVPNLKGGSLVIPAGWLLAQQGQSDPQGVDATARKRVELLAMNAVFDAEKAPYPALAIPRSPRTFNNCWPQGGHRIDHALDKAPATAPPHAAAG